MAHIFISYAKEDREQAAAVAGALESLGWQVFWDRSILPGRIWDEVIEEAIEAAGCILVLWSRNSVASEWVRAEAEEGRHRKILIPVLIEEAKIPLIFRPLQAASLVDWYEDSSYVGFKQLVHAITEIMGAPPPSERQKAIKTGVEDKAKRPERAPVKPEVKAPATTAAASAVKPEPPVAAKPSETSPPKKFTNSSGMEFLLIPAGSFTMGSSTDDKNEKPPHDVKIPQSFYLQTTEVTQGQWRKVMGDNPSEFKQCGDDCPVESVSWEDAKRFIEKLNQGENTRDYRLPSEAEWEYACRAGTTTDFSFGDDPRKLGEYAWYDGNSNDKTHRVAAQKPNSWGLYDMHGNVWEWVEDDYHNSYSRAPADGRAWVDNPRGSRRVVRGGSWSNVAQVCRSAFRGYGAPDYRLDNLGFRLSRSVALGP